MAEGFASDDKLPLTGGTMTGTLTLDGYPALRIPAGAGVNKVLTSDGSGNAAWAAAAGGGASLTPVAPITADPAPAAAGTFYPVDVSGGNVTVTLPNAPAAGTMIGIKLIKTGTGTTVTVTRGGTDVFNVAGGSVAMTLALLFQGVILQYNAGIWLVQADDLPLSQTDLRYLALTGGTMSGAIAMGSNKVTGLANGSAGSDAAAFGQIPAALPPNGTAGGVLTGTYPNPGITTLNQNTTGTAAGLSSTLAVGSGGTGQTSASAAFNALSPNTTLGDVTYGSGTNTSTRLAGDTSNTRKFLRTQASSGVAQAPAWDTVAAGDLPAATTSTQGAVILDGTAGDIQPGGTQAAGSSTKAAAANHVHPGGAVIYTATTSGVAVPAGATLLKVVVVGGSGAGGGSAGSSPSQIGASGGGGGCGQQVEQYVPVSGATYAVTVGGGGTGGIAGTINQGVAGGNGNGAADSVFNYNAGAVIVTAKAGGAGVGGALATNSGANGGVYGRSSTTAVSGGIPGTGGPGGGSNGVGGNGGAPFGFTGGGGGGGGGANAGTANGTGGAAGVAAGAGTGGGAGAGGGGGTQAGGSAAANSGAGGGGAGGTATVVSTGAVGAAGGNGGSGFVIVQVVG